MQFETLEEGLNWIKKSHFKEMDLGLERVKAVLQRLNIQPPPCPVITVAGTNGKGSCVAALQAIYDAQGYKVGAYTSPYLYRYNEQVTLQGIPVANKCLVEAFTAVSEVMDEITLTPFEFSTLAAFWIFKNNPRDIWILEVGLGGRLDAVNSLPADVAIISTVAMDHMEWLGHTRELIGYEKAGIFKPNAFAVCGDFDPPASVIETAQALNTTLFCQNKHFGYEKEKESWRFWSQTQELKNLPQPTLQLQNMATVLKTVELLQPRCPVSRPAIDQGLKNVTLPGRIQVLPGLVSRVFDVAHNPAAIELLTHYLSANPISGKNLAVFSMLSDKDIEESLRVIQKIIDYWYVAPIDQLRGATLDLLKMSFHNTAIREVEFFKNVKEAYGQASQVAKQGDRLVIFGSFHTVAETAVI